MINEIEMTTFLSPPQDWMRKLVLLPFDKVVLDTFINDLIDRILPIARKTNTKTDEVFVIKYLPFNSLVYNKVNPSDGLLHRLKYLCEVSDNPYARKLYDCMCSERAIYFINTKLGSDYSLSTMEENEELSQAHSKFCADLDNEYYEIVHRDPKQSKSIRNTRGLAKKFKEFLQLYQVDQFNLAASFQTIMRLGEFLKRIFPNRSNEEISRQVKLFTAELKYNNITEGTAITMADYVVKNIPHHSKMVNPELHDFYIKNNIPYSAKVDDFRLGLNAMRWLLESNKLAQDTTHNNLLIFKSKEVFTNDLLPYSAPRVELDAVILEIEKYANSKYNKDEKKYLAATQLVNELRKNSLKYFGNYPKSFSMTGEHHQKCLAAIEEAKAILGKHRDPYMDRLMFKLAVVIATIFTGGLALFCSESCWATLFHHETKGMRLLNKATEALKTPISPVLS